MAVASSSKLMEAIPSSPDSPMGDGDSSVKDAAPATRHNLIVKWSGKEIEIEDINRLKTVRDLKQMLQAKTGVQMDRQKLLNLTYKGD